MRLLVSAIEPSSNKYLEQILTLLPKNIEVVGLCDKNILPSSIYDIKEFSVMGISSVIPKIFLFKKAIKDMVELSKSCNYILLLDAPSFNLRIAKEIKNIDCKKKIFYYILPKAWVWKKSRIKTVDKLIDYQISILPFEKIFFKHSHFFGNPLVDEYKNNNIDFSKNKYIAYLPGSRSSEIKSLMPIFREQREKIEKIHNKKSILIIPNHFDEEYIQQTYGDISNFKIIRNTKEAFEISHFAFVCSGTATLEASLQNIPFVLIYKFKLIDLFAFKIALKFSKSDMLKINKIGLANIIAYYAHQKSFHQEIAPLKESYEILEAYKNFDFNNYSKNIKNLNRLFKQQNDNSSIQNVVDFITQKMGI